MTPKALADELRRQRYQHRDFLNPRHVATLVAAERVLYELGEYVREINGEPRLQETAGD